MKKLLNELKLAYPWITKVSAHTLATSILDLGLAYGKFFKIQKEGEKFTKATRRKAKKQNRKLTVYDMKGYPNFKKKRDAKESFYVRHENMYFIQGCANIECVGKIKIRSSYELPEGRGVTKFSNSRIKFENNKWLLTFGMECENQAPELNNFSLGIDVGLKDLAVTSTGNVFKNINKTKRVKKLEKKLKYRQRQQARRYVKEAPRSIGFLKTKEKIKSIYFKLAMIRKNYLHHTSKAIVAELPETIVMEDLNIAGMMKNKHLSKAISKQRWYELRMQIEYKAKGIKVLFADRWYPSSKTCSSCGVIKSDLKLKDRTFNCSCGLSLDRDLNAAINLSKLA